MRPVVRVNPIFRRLGKFRELKMGIRKRTGATLMRTRR
jgi:hypothetical protein